MIKLSNSHELEYVTASGALGFDGEGWAHEKLLVRLGAMKLHLFVRVLRTLTEKPLLYPTSNLSWIRPWTWLPWSPWSCIRFLPNNVIANKVGLYNPGLDWWLEEVAPRLDFQKNRLVVSLYGTAEELYDMVRMLNPFELVAIEINVSCPNTGHKAEQAESIISTVIRARSKTRHPLILKLGVDQNYLTIVDGVAGYVEAISLNNVVWKMAMGSASSPLEKIGRPGSGGGGISGRWAQPLNWKAVENIATLGKVPVIGPSIMRYEDLVQVRKRGAEAVHFGAIHLKTPWLPTQIVLQDMRNRQARAQ